MLTAMNALAITLNAKYSNQLECVLSTIAEEAKYKRYKWTSKSQLEKEVVSYLVKLGYYCYPVINADGKVATEVSWE